MIKVSLSSSTSCRDSTVISGPASLIRPLVQYLRKRTPWRCSLVRGHENLWAQWFCHLCLCSVLWFLQCSPSTWPWAFILWSLKACDLSGNVSSWLGLKQQEKSGIGCYACERNWYEKWPREKEEVNFIYFLKSGKTRSIQPCWSLSADAILLYNPSYMRGEFVTPF